MESGQSESGLISWRVLVSIIPLACIPDCYKKEARACRFKGDTAPRLLLA